MEGIIHMHCKYKLIARRILAWDLIERTKRSGELVHHQLYQPH
jgi:hypothetical protein